MLHYHLSFDAGPESGKSAPEGRTSKLDDLLIWIGGLAIFLRGMNRYGQPMVTPYEATTLAAKLRRFSRSSRFSEIIAAPDDHTGHAEDIENTLLAVVRSRIQEFKNTDQDDLSVVLAKLLDRL